MLMQSVSRGKSVPKDLDLRINGSKMVTPAVTTKKSALAGVAGHPEELLRLLQLQVDLGMLERMANSSLQHRHLPQGLTRDLQALVIV
eukprot:4873466-Karenia_brevis.AAC.1